MRFKTLISIYLLVFSVFLSLGQLLEVEVSSKMETESFQRMINHESEIYFFRKVKSKEATAKKFLLTKYSKDGEELIWESIINLNQFQNVLKFTCLNSHLQLFIVIENKANKQAELSVRQYDLITGRQSLNKSLFHAKINEWQDSFGKAYRAQSFSSAIDAVQDQSEVTALEYRFDIEFSPDSSKIAVYRFDYSQERLIVNTTIFDLDFNTLFNLETGVDDAHVSHGVKIDNDGNLYLLKISNSGRLVVVKFNTQNEVTAYLTVPRGSTIKSNPNLFIHTNKLGYVSYCNFKGGDLVGTSIYALNFDEEKAVKNKFFKFDTETLDRVGLSAKSAKYAFEITETLEVNDKVIIVLEQHFIEGTDVHYDPNTVEKIENSLQASGVVYTNNLLIFVYDKELETIKKFEVSKHQKGNVFDGLNTLSYKVYRKEGQLIFVYTNSKKDRVNDELFIQLLDTEKENISEPKKIELPRSNLAVIVSSALLVDHKLMIQTRKGILGKKNYLGVYEY